MHRYHFILLFSLISNFLCSQNLCESDTLLSLEKINFEIIEYVKTDTIINGFKYNRKYKCPNSKTLVLGNFNIFGKKSGFWNIIKSDGKSFVKGKFKNNKKSGVWEYELGGDIYKKGIYKGFSFPISF